MTADNADSRHKAEQVRVVKRARKAVFVQRKTYPVQILIAPLKVYAEHKAEKSYRVKYCGGDNHKIRQKIQLVLEVEVSLGVHSVENEKADKGMEKHYRADYRGQSDVKEYRQKRSRDKGAYPNAEAHFEKRVVTVLVKINQPQSPDEQKRKHHITEELNIRHHTQKQVDYINYSEKRSIVQKTFYPIHSENSLFLRL